MGDHHVKHGDGVRDVAFTCDDTVGIFNKCIERGATAVQEPETLEDENGKVIVASVKTYGDTIHSFIQRVDYNGVFLPGYKESPHKETLN